MYPTLPTYPPPAPAPKRHWKLKAAALVGMLVAGVAIGSAGDGSAETVTAQKPETVTRTETVTDTVEVAPQSCIDALDEAENLRGVMVDFTTDVVVKYPPMVQRAYELGTTFSDVDGLVTRIHRLTDRTDELTGDLTGIVDRYLTASDACREAAE